MIKKLKWWLSELWDEIVYRFWWLMGMSVLMLYTFMRKLAKKVGVE